MYGLGCGIALAHYGTLRLTEASPVQTFTEIFDATEIRSYLRLPARVPPDPAEDDFLTSLIIGAREMAEIAQNRDLVRKQWDLTLDYWPNYHLHLREPLVSVDLAQYRDSDGNVTAMAENTNYVVDASKSPGCLTPPYGETWPAFTPWPSSAILVRFRSGLTAGSAFWSDAGARVKIGMKLLISEWFLNRVPFVPGLTLQEIPHGITNCLETGAVPRSGR